MVLTRAVETGSTYVQRRLVRLYVHIYKGAFIGVVYFNMAKVCGLI